ncbi:MAG: thioredoxin family protein [Pirellulales bacterium]|nr:thioredoxin family protein [Pirellulales bacterium]
MSRRLALVALFSTALSLANFALADRPSDTQSRPNAAKNVKWTNDYGLALALCKATQKPLLIILEEPETPAFKILPAAMITEQTNDQILANYILCRIDVTTAYGQSVAKCFKTTQFPYTAIIDKRGAHILYKKAGKFDTKQWVTTLAEYKSGERKAFFQENCFT